MSIYISKILKKLFKNFPKVFSYWQVYSGPASLQLLWAWSYLYIGNYDKAAVASVSILFMFFVYGEKRFFTISNSKTNFSLNTISGLH